MTSATIWRRVLLWAPPLAYMGFIFYLSSESDPLPGLTRVVWDKALHGGGYALLGALLARAATGEGRRSAAAWMFGAIAGSIYGASDEWHQSFVAGRDADVLDWAADTVGSAVGATCLVVLVSLWHGQIVRRWPRLARLHGLVGTSARVR